MSMLNTENKTNMDKSMLGDLDNLPEEDKLRMSSMIDQLQIRDRYNLDSIQKTKSTWTRAC
jgi:hypothetical protein